MEVSHTRTATRGPRDLDPGQSTDPRRSGWIQRDPRIQQELDPISSTDPTELTHSSIRNKGYK